MIVMTKPLTAKQQRRQNCRETEDHITEIRVYTDAAGFRESEPSMPHESIKLAICPNERTKDHILISQGF